MAPVFKTQRKALRVLASLCLVRPLGYTRTLIKDAGIWRKSLGRLWVRTYVMCDGQAFHIRCQLMKPSGRLGKAYIR